MNRITVTGSPDTIRWRFKATGDPQAAIGRVLQSGVAVPHAFLKITKVS